MIGQFERHCPKCGAGISRYNDEPFCRPCKAEPGFAWHWSPALAQWIEIPVVEQEAPFVPAPGDLLLTQAFQPAPRKRDNWDRWRKTEAASV